MENLMKWILKHKICIGCIFFVLIIGVPFIIHVLFSVKIQNDFFVAKWSAGELLSYYGTILSFLGTIILGIIAIKQNNQIRNISKEANDVNLRMLKLEECAKKSYITIKNVNISNDKFISIQFKTLNSDQISSFSVMNSNTMFRGTEWKDYRDAMIKGMKELVITDVKNHFLVAPYYDGRDICIILEENKIEPGEAITICFIVELINVWGYKTKQKFSVSFCYSQERKIEYLESHTMEI